MAKYCPQVAAVRATQKHAKTCDLDLRSVTLKSNKLLDVVKVGFIFVQNFIKLSAAVHELSW